MTLRAMTVSTILIAVACANAASAQNTSPPQGVEPLPVDFSRRRIFISIANTGRIEVHALQHAPPTHRYVGGRQSRTMGRLQCRPTRRGRREPVRYATAGEHYAALLRQANAHGGPTSHPRSTLPDWDGWYNRGGAKISGFMAAICKRRLCYPF